MTDYRPLETSHTQDYGQPELVPDVGMGLLAGGAKEHTRKTRPTTPSVSHESINAVESNEKVPGVHERMLNGSSQESSGQLQPRKSGFHSRNADQLLTGIIFPVIIITLPFLFIVASLLGIILAHRVERSAPVSSPLRLTSDADDTDAYYVDWSATQLSTLTSWASNIATVLPGFIMTLFSYRLANSFMMDSANAKSKGLPTPYQLGLLLSSLDAKLISLWHGLSYEFSDKG